MGDEVIEINLNSTNPLDANLEKLLNLAELTVKKAKTLLHCAVGEDSEDLISLMNSVENYMETQDAEGVETALNELTNLVYYLELSPH